MTDLDSGPSQIWVLGPTVPAGTNLIEATIALQEALVARDPAMAHFLKEQRAQQALTAEAWLRFSERNQADLNKMGAFHLRRKQVIEDLIQKQPAPVKELLGQLVLDRVQRVKYAGEEPGELYGLAAWIQLLHLARLLAAT